MNGESSLASVASHPVNVAPSSWRAATRSAGWVDVATSWIGSPYASRWPIVLPVVSLCVFTALFRWTQVDLAISSLFYDRNEQHWSWFFHTGCTLFYRGGIYPAFGLFGIGFISLFVAHLRGHWQLYRAGWFLVLLFIIGPGLIVNHGFKNHWGRPRPHQVQEFDGPHAFVSLGSPGTLQQHNSSFPSGHAAVAFYLIAPAFLASSRHRGLSTRLMIIGLVFGGAMATVRVMQGGHFVSDVVWSAAVVYFTAVLLSKLILRSPVPLAAPNIR